jgi:hypothetical protein
MAFLASDAEASEVGGGFTASPDEASEVPGAAESFGRGLLRNIPLGQQAAAAIAPVNPWSDKSNYSDEMAHLTDAAEQAKAQNGGAYYTGAAAGTLLPLAIPGVGEALEAAPIAGNAALGAIQGVSDADVVKNPGQAAGNAAIGGGIGAIMGQLGKYFAGAKGAPVGEAAPPVEPVAPTPAPAIKDPITMEPGNESPLPEMAQSQAPAPAPRKVGPQIDGTNVPEGKKVAADFVPSADRIYASNLAQGMGGTPRKFMGIFGKQDPVQSLVKIGNWMETAGDGGKPISGLLDRPGELLHKVDEIHASSGKVIGGIIDKLGTEGDVDTQRLLTELQDFSDKTADPATAGRIDRLVATTQRNLEKGIGDFDSLQEIKGMAGKQLKKDPEMAEVYGHLADMIESHVNQLGASMKDPAMAQAYAKAKLDYTNTSRLLPILQYGEWKDIVGGPAGHHTLRGLLGNIFNMASAMTTGTTPEQLVQNSMLKAAPIARSVANAGAGAKTAVANAVRKAPSSLGRKAAQLMGTNAAQKELSDYLSSKFGKGK